MNRHSRIWRRRGILAGILALVLPLANFALAEEPPAATQPPILAEALPLLERNPDTIGWLKVGDVVDMPVVQRDNDYYLHHNFDGKETSRGTVFLDEECSILPRDENLVLYGHNMRDGAVFGNLSRFRELSYLKKHPIATFDTIYQEGKYVIVAVYDMSAETEDSHFMQMLRFNFIDNEYFMGFYYEARDRSYYKIPVDVQYGDKLLTLITCSYTYYDGRLILILRELREDEDPNEVAALMQDTVLR